MYAESVWPLAFRHECPASSRQTAGRPTPRDREPFVIQIVIMDYLAGNYGPRGEGAPRAVSSARSIPISFSR
jgi:hypothetical protein